MRTSMLQLRRGWFQKYYIVLLLLLLLLLLYHFRFLLQLHGCLFWGVDGGMGDGGWGDRV